MRDAGWRVILATSATVALLVVLALGATSHFGRIASPAPVGPVVPHYTHTAPLFSPPPSAPPRAHPPSNPITIPAWVGPLLLGIAVLAVVGIIVLVLARAVRDLGRRRDLEQAEADHLVDAEALPELVEAVAESLSDTLIRLRTGDQLDDVILECWRRLEDAAAATGVPRLASQTAEEFTVGVLSATPATPDDLRTLADLYRRAMFSTLPAEPADRARAVDALERLISALGGGVS